MKTNERLRINNIVHQVGINSVLQITPQICDQFASSVKITDPNTAQIRNLTTQEANEFLIYNFSKNKKRGRGNTRNRTMFPGERNPV